MFLAAMFAQGLLLGLIDQPLPPPPTGASASEKPDVLHVAASLMTTSALVVALWSILRPRAWRSVVGTALVAGLVVAAAIACVEIEVVPLEWVAVVDSVTSTLAALALMTILAGQFYSRDLYGFVVLTLVAVLLMLPNQVEPILQAQYPHHQLPRGVARLVSLPGLSLLASVVGSFVITVARSDSTRIGLLRNERTVDAAVVVVDIRGFSKWTRDAALSRAQIRFFLDAYYQHVLEALERGVAARWKGERWSDRVAVRPVGDRVLVCVREDGEDAARSVGKLLAASLYTFAANFRSEMKTRISDQIAATQVPPVAVGIGVGRVVQVQFQHGSDDFIGQPVHAALRLQRMMRRGGIAVESALKQAAGGDLPAGFAPVGGDDTVLSALVGTDRPKVFLSYPYGTTPDREEMGRRADALKVVLFAEGFEPRDARSLDAAPLGLQVQAEIRTCDALVLMVGAQEHLVSGWLLAEGSFALGCGMPLLLVCGAGVGAPVPFVLDDFRYECVDAAAWKNANGWVLGQLKSRFRVHYR